MNKYFLFLCFILAPNILYPQYSFSSQSVEKIYSKISQFSAINANISELDTNLIFFDLLVKGHQVKVKIIKTAPKKIDHIGLAIFREQKQIKNKQQFRFLERVLLEYVLQRDAIKATSIASDAIVISLNGIQYNSFGFQIFDNILDILNNYTDFKLRRNDYRYKATFQSASKDSLELIFPAHISLIKGKDKFELETDLYSELVVLNKTSSPTSLEPKGTVIPIFKNDSLEVLEENTIFGLFHSGKTYIKNGDERQLLYNWHYPSQSIANLFVAESVEIDSITLNVTLHQYGNIIKRIQLPLNKLNSFFLKSHIPFTAIDSLSKDSLEATILYKSVDYDYLHMLIVRTNITKIEWGKSSALEADFYSYIRQDNIKNLFSKYRKSKIKKYQIKGILGE